MEADRFLAPLQATRITGRWLARKAGTPSIAALWDLLAERPFPVATARIDKEEFDNRFPGIRAMITKRAADAIAHRIDLLGSGPVELGAEIDWLRDFKTGDRWPPAFCRSIDYVNKGRPSDVKCPWELSRLQWLIPAAQAYQFTGDEAYAVCVRDILLQWIEANPYAWTVNWSCTMEPALRLQTWTYFFHVFARTAAWQSREFQARYLSMLYLHGVFTEKHIERSTINGNHLTADAAGMVFAGLFFRGIGDGDRWAEQGWQTLEQEIRLQVYPDGIDFEASTAYHRLCAELFLGPARYRLAAGLPVNDLYEARLRKMADFVDAYMRPDGTSPNWGMPTTAERCHSAHRRWGITAISPHWSKPRSARPRSRVRQRAERKLHGMAAWTALGLRLPLQLSNRRPSLMVASIFWRQATTMFSSIAALSGWPVLEDMATMMPYPSRLGSAACL